MDIDVDIRGFLEIHVWICYGFSDQGRIRDFILLYLRIEPRIAHKINNFILIADTGYTTYWAIRAKDTSPPLSFSFFDPVAARRHYYVFLSCVRV